MPHRRTGQPLEFSGPRGKSGGVEGEPNGAKDGMARDLLPLIGGQITPDPKLRILKPGERTDDLTHPSR
jgi:hypothetical protein